MGSVFDKDILYGGMRLDQAFEWGEGQENGATFILHDARVLGEVDTDIGTATKTGLIVSRIESPTDVLSVGTLSGPIGAKFAVVDDLKNDPNVPAVVTVFTAPAKKEGHNDATVLQFVRKWDGEIPAELPELVAVNDGIPY